MGRRVLSGSLHHELSIEERREEDKAWTVHAGEWVRRRR